MQFHAITLDNVAENLDLLKKHHAARASIFPGWEAPNYLAGLEGDVFDSPVFRPVWALVTEGDDVLCVGRMIPADGPATMIETVWPEALEFGLPPKEHCFEVHRLGTMPGISREAAVASALMLRIELEEISLSQGRPHLFLMTAEKIFQSALQTMLPIGPVVDVDGVPSRALITEMTVAEIDRKRDLLRQLTGEAVGHVA